MHQRRNLLLVGLDLVVSGGEPFVGVFRNLQLDDSERQSVDEHDDVRPAIVLAFNDGELVHRQPVVRVGIIEVDQPDVIARDASVITAILDRNTVAQHAMKRAIVADERRRIVSQHFAQRFFARVARNRGIQSRDRIAQSADEHDIGKRAALRRDFARREMRRVGHRISEFFKPS